ncbi:unnamed protein product [Clonostachys byssicola]|uniref:Protein kinase domain-containing protein n=1 Tax=Clonostachys byssicola TaxID=160290 RepID=A0A9N9XZV8_9HYPO|nr:unnamed protein product [Clonostachys byssicola]
MATDISASSASSGSFSNRVRSSRVPISASASGSWRTHHLAIDEVPDDLRAFYDIGRALEAAGVPGPANLIPGKKQIGQGAQFVVYRQRMARSEGGSFVLESVAVKQPKFHLDASRQLNMADGQAKRHLEDICLEVRSLTVPALRNHANIARLLAWSFDMYSLHHPISLIMEMALSDLEQVLDQQAISSWQAYHLCSHIAAAIDAIHQCSVIHGDIKPRNVLIFDQRDGLVAKLADFGLSIAGEAVARLGGTPGWQAPEVERGECLTVNGMKKADMYSFGLVAWKTIFTSGNSSPPPPMSPQGRHEWLLSETKKATSFTMAFLLSEARTAFPALLNENPDERPENAERLFSESEGLFDASEVESRDQLILNLRRCVDRWDRVGAAAAEDSEDDDTMSEHLPIPSHAKLDNSLPDHVFNPHDLTQRHRYSWEIPRLGWYFLSGLSSSSAVAREALLPEVIFATFLFSTGSQTQTATQKKAILDLLLTAATRGYQPARAAAPTALAWYYGEIPSDRITQVMKWLQTAVASGSISARRQLDLLGPESMPASIQEFRAHGGYASHYLANQAVDGLPGLASFGTLEKLNDYITSAGVGFDIEERTKEGETALYLACARGSWDIAAELLDRGANASVVCTEFGITCLHWLFAFDSALQSTVANRLVSSGANINAVIPQPVPFLHFPFHLPSGTPLHWAVATKSHTTIKVLIDLGAQLDIRDGSDPYRYDNRVRLLSDGDPPEELYALPETQPLGLSPIDYAAMDHDPFIFEYLVSSGRTIQINAVDDEGLTVLHRLSAGHIRRTLTGIRFSSLPFKDSPAMSRGQLKRTVAAIKSLGGDLERLTTPSTTYYDGTIEPYSPLIMATLGGCRDVVTALLEGGANIHTENEYGTQAIDRPCEDNVICYETVRILSAAGADINHKDKLTSRTLLYTAAARRNFDLMELLLSLGADIEEKVAHRFALEQGWGIFALLAHTEPPFDETADVRIAELLNKYVLGHVDAEKRRRVIEHADDRGQTMLHRFAMHFMRHSVSLLLNHVSQINSPSLCQGGIKSKNAQHQTPLDVAMESMEMLEQSMHETPKYSIPEYESLLERAKAVVKALQDVEVKLYIKG